MNDATPAKDQEKIWVRLPDGMRDKLSAAAKANMRSANAEVVARLEESFKGRPGLELIFEHYTEVIGIFREIKALLEETQELAAEEIGYLDQWIADQPKPRPTRAQAVRYVLRNWLAARGYPDPQDPK